MYANFELNQALCQNKRGFVTSQSEAYKKTKSISQIVILYIQILEQNGYYRHLGPVSRKTR